MFCVKSADFGRMLQGLREHSVVLMGKNTLMKRCIRQYADRTQDDKWNVLLDYLVGNVGIIFTTVSLLHFSESAFSLSLSNGFCHLKCISNTSIAANILYIAHFALHLSNLCSLFSVCRCCNSRDKC